jgi:hypothetical protein
MRFAPQTTLPPAPRRFARSEVRYPPVFLQQVRTSSPCDVLTSTPQVQSRGAAGWLPGGTPISTISRRRLVHNAAYGAASAGG